MAATDLVPCYYTGQNWRVEAPAATHPRYEVREFKRQQLGEFIQNGKFFLFYKRLAKKVQQLWDGPFGVGNLLPFFKAQNPLIAPQKLHYEVPPAGAVGMHKWGMRTVSGVHLDEGFMRLRKSITTRTTKVSARKIDVTAVSFRQRYGATLPHRIAPSPSLDSATQQLA